MTEVDEHDAIFGPPLYYYRSNDAQPEQGEPKPQPSWPDSLPVLDFDGSDEALERGQIGESHD